MGAHYKCALQEMLAHLPGAAAVVLEIQVAAALAPGRLLVPEPEAQELGRIVREIGLDGPLRSRVGRVLGPVVAEAQLPFRQLAVVERPDLAVDVETLAVALARPVEPVRVGDDDVTEGDEVLAQKGERGALPAGRRVLVLGVEADDGAALLRGRLAGCDRGAELDGAPVVQLEERPDPAPPERVRDLVAPAGAVVL